MRIALRRSIAEGIGTYFLVLIGAGAAVANAWSGGAVGHVGIALAFALVVLAVIYAIGHLSGAHINPAVTLGFWAAGRFPGGEAVRYIVAQCVGGVLAGLTLLWVAPAHVDAGATVPAIPTGPAFAVEGLLSFLLMFVIMAVATDARVADGFAGMAIGLTVGCNALMGGLLTGASMNPARSLGPAAGGGVWEAHWLYWLAPMTGMVVAARTYELLRPVQAPEVVPPGVPLGVEGPMDLPRPSRSGGMNR